jgi:hypothetical protein
MFAVLFFPVLQGFGAAASGSFRNLRQVLLEHGPSA